MEETRGRSEETIQLERGLQQLNAGDSSVRGELLNIACQRLFRLAAKLRKSFPAIAASATTEDIFEQASLRLYETLDRTLIQDSRHFYRLAAFQIRRELIEIGRRCQQQVSTHRSPDDSANEARAASDERVTRPANASPSDAVDLEQWIAFHDSVDALGDPQREVFELHWYHELPCRQVAELLQVDEASVRRRWRDARLQLHDLLKARGVSMEETPD